MTFIEFADEPSQEERINKLRAELEKLGGNTSTLESMPADMEEEFLRHVLEYETAEQIKAMSPCNAAVEERQPCYSIFRTADGKKFSIGSPAATREVVQFLGTLKEGQVYQFPGIFLDYQKQ